jgi:hypothetical protein
MSKYITLAVTILSIIVLAVVIFYQSPSVHELSTTPELTPEEQLELFMADKMNYGIRFSRLLAERRIEQAEQIAREHNELTPRAREVIDTLQARLAREAQM